MTFFEIVKDTDESLYLVTSDIDIAIVNGLRRILLDEIVTPCFAWEEFPDYNITKSVDVLSCITNESTILEIKTRVPYISIATEPFSTYKEELECFICDPDDTLMPLINYGDEDMYVRTDMMRCFRTSNETGDITTELSKAEMKELFPEQNFRITKLQKGDEIHVKLFPVLGTGMIHNSWSIPTVGYSFVATPMTDAELNEI